MAEFETPISRSEAILTSIINGSDYNEIPLSRLEALLLELKTGVGKAESISYLTEAPTSANTDGLKFVVLSSNPATKYDGYIYIITGA